MEERKYRFLFDTKTLRPGCVIVQTLFGGDKQPCMWFNYWATAPTPDMGWLEGTEAEVKKLAEVCNRRNP